MLKRVHVKGYKSLTNVEVEFEPLVVLFGPNAFGKSNLLDLPSQTAPRPLHFRP